MIVQQGSGKTGIEMAAQIQIAYPQCIIQLRCFLGLTVVKKSVQVDVRNIVSNVAWAAAEGILSATQAANAVKSATRAEVAMAMYTYLTKTAK